MPVYENLQNIISNVDFVIFLIPSLDQSENKFNSIARDNIMFELGMSMGMGKPLITLIEKNPKSKLPSDLSGIMYLQYESGKIQENFHYIKNWAKSIS